jgi:carbamoyltransferase
LQQAGLSLADVDHLAVNQNSRANLLRKILYLGKARPNDT